MAVEVNGCFNKKGYATKADAVRNATHNGRLKKPLRAYQCPLCRQFHLTSKPHKPERYRKDSQCPD